MTCRTDLDLLAQVTSPAWPWCSTCAAVWATTCSTRTSPRPSSSSCPGSPSGSSRRPSRPASPWASPRCSLSVRGAWRLRCKQNKTKENEGKTGPAETLIGNCLHNNNRIARRVRYLVLDGSSKVHRASSAKFTSTFRFEGYVSP